MSKFSKPEFLPSLRDKSIPRLGAGSPYPDAACAAGEDWNSDSLSEFSGILARRKAALLFAALLGLAIALLVTRLQTPSYRARSLIELEDLNENFLSTWTLNSTGSEGRLQSPDSAIRTQSLILQSSPILERAIDRLDLEKRVTTPAPPRIRLPWLPRLPRLPASRKTSVPPREQALRILQARLQVHPQPNTQIIEVSFEAADPQLAADVVNSIAAGFAELNLDRRQQASESTGKWLSQRLADVRSKLEYTEDELQKYASGSDLMLLSDKDNSAEERLRQLQLALVKAKEELFAKQSAFEMISAAPAESLPEVLDDSTLKEYQLQLVTLRRQLADMSSSFTDAYPKVANLKAQIVAVETALDKKREDIVTRIRNEYGAAARREKLLDAEYMAQTGVVSKEGSRVAHYSVLKREVETNRQLYDSMLQRVRAADLASAMRAPEINVVEPATPPRAPYKPNPVFNAAVGLFSGLMGGAAFAIRRARSYRGIQDIGQLATELKVPELGVIPSKIRGSRVAGLLGRNGSNNPLELTTWQQWPSAMSESFRLTLTSILLAQNNGAKPRVIAISSANPGEGKTTVISNLGIALARTNRRVLLVDGDMRRPRLHQIYNVENTMGLSDVLAGTSPLPIHATNIPNLSLLPSGRNADERLVFAAEFRRLLRRLRDEFDMVLVDTPPLLYMSDARLIINLADAAILVVAQHTDRAAIRLAQQRLTADGSSLLGVIINNWDPKSGSNGNRYRHDPYKSYYPHNSAV